MSVCCIARTPPTPTHHHQPYSYSSGNGGQMMAQCCFHSNAPCNTKVTFVRIFLGEKHKRSEKETIRELG